MIVISQPLVFAISFVSLKETFLLIFSRRREDLIMSEGGGYYKYRCKNWLTYNCEEWVWVNGAACVNCLVLQYLSLHGESGH